MSNIGVVAPYGALPATRAADDAAAAAPTAEQETIAKQFPAGTVQLERTGVKTALRIPGGLLALGGAAVLGISLLSRGGGIETRLRLSSMMLGGGLVGAGAAAVLGAELMPPKSKFALATKIPTETRANEIARMFTDRRTAVVQDKSGAFAVIDEGPRVVNGGSAGRNYSGNGHYYGDGHYHGQHYYGDGHNHSPNFYPDPYYPGSGNYYPDPYYPAPSGGSTGRGDDYSPSYPNNSGSGSSTGRGDDGGGSSYDPPSYDPPSYDPPSYDPPSYDPPSYDPPSYDPPSYSNDSSSNGNPSGDDF